MCEERFQWKKCKGQVNRIERSCGKKKNLFESLATYLVFIYLNSVLSCIPICSASPRISSFPLHHQFMFAQQLPGFAFTTAMKLQAAVTWTPLWIMPDILFTTFETAKGWNAG